MDLKILEIASNTENNKVLGNKRAHDHKLPWIPVSLFNPKRWDTFETGNSKGY